MRIRAGWRWLRALRENPIYLREKGNWGTPNPYYATLMRYSPFVVMGAILFGLCTGSVNPTLLSGNDNLAIFTCLLCLPGMVLSALTLGGSILAPALTAPMISLELAQGTWDILRLTPQSTGGILLAKLFGALARMRIWTLLLALSVLQGGLIGCVSVIGGGEWGLTGVLVGFGTLLRPWLEILFAAFVGMFISTWTHSATTALASSYALIMIVRVLNSSALWLVVGSALGLGEVGMLSMGMVGPLVLYGLLLAGLAWGIFYRAAGIGQTAV